jgi:predicted MFS family arabinose efflux permease
MIEQLALTPSTAGLLTALVVFANVPGNVIGGVLVNRGVPRWVLIAVAQATMGASMLAMQLAPIPDLARYAAAILFSLVGGLLPASVLAGAPRHAGDPSRIGLVNGMIVQGANLGTVSGPPILAFLVATLGNWQVASPLIAGFALMGIGAALALRKVEARP